MSEPPMIRLDPLLATREMGLLTPGLGRHILERLML